MLVNCLTSASYVSTSTPWRSSQLDGCKTLTLLFYMIRSCIGPLDAQTNQVHGFLRLGLDVLQQPIVNTRAGHLLIDCGRLVSRQHRPELVRFFFFVLPNPSFRSVFDVLPLRCGVFSPEETRNFLLFAIAFSGAAAVGISYTTAWCVRVTSSTTYRFCPLIFCLCLVKRPERSFSHFIAWSVR